MPKEPAVKAAPTVFSLKVTLGGIRPPIWRRILVPGTTTLGKLHDVLQAAMGWTDSHLHAFTVGERSYGAVGQLDGAADENRMTLDRIVKSGINRFEYTYDFGDNWDHALLIEKRAPKADGLTLPACVAGARQCPPEDCGGVWGYADLLDILADPDHPEREERLEWIGEESFDVEAFDLARADAAVRAAFTARKSRGVWMKA